MVQYNDNNIQFNSIDVTLMGIGKKVGHLDNANATSEDLVDIASENGGKLPTVVNAVEIDWNEAQVSTPDGTETVNTSGEMLSLVQRALNSTGSEVTWSDGVLKKTSNGQTTDVVSAAQILEAADGATFTQIKFLPTRTEVNELLENYQEELVSGTNIKTINNQSLLGSGNITITQGSNYTDADAKKAIVGSNNTSARINTLNSLIDGAVIPGGGEGGTEVTILNNWTDGEPRQDAVPSEALVRALFAEEMQWY